MHLSPEDQSHLPLSNYIITFYWWVVVINKYKCLDLIKMAHDFHMYGKYPSIERLCVMMLRKRSIIVFVLVGSLLFGIYKTTKT